MEKNKRFKAPIQMEMVIYVTNDTKIGKITINFEIGQIPTEEEVINRIKRFKNNNELVEQLGEDWRFMTPEEMLNSYLQDKYGALEKYALPLPLTKYVYEF